MRAPQLLSWGSLLALLVALIVVLAGQQAQVRDLLEPGDQGNVSRSKAASDSVIGQGDEAAVNSDLQTLVQEAIYQRVGEDGAGDGHKLQLAISRSEPQIPLGKPLSMGGISLKVFGSGGSSVVFCAKPDYYFVCQSINLETRQQAEGKSSRLKDATYQAEVVGVGKAKKRAGGRPSGRAATPSGAGVVQSAIQRAEQLKQTGVR